MLTGTVVGNLGRDAELKYAQQSGDAILDFSVAVNEKGRDGEKKTTWVRCAIFGRRAEALAQYLKKGAYVTATGSMSLREYQPREGGATKVSLDMRVSEIDFKTDGGRREGGALGAPEESRGGGNGGAPAQRGGYGGGEYGRGAPTGRAAPPAGTNGPSGGARAPAPPADAGGPPPPDDGYPPNDDDIPFVSCQGTR